MFLPADYQWLEPAVIGAVIIFFIALIGNALSFSNRFVNALVTAIVYVVVFAGIILGGGALVGDASKLNLAPEQWIPGVLAGAVVAFVADLIGNAITFQSRVGNAFVTALIFLLILAALSYGMPAIQPGGTPA